jgi:hypothetical protein
MSEQKICNYCGKPLWGSSGELSVTSLKATRIDFDKVVDTNIENEIFCDARCLGNAILEMSWIHENEPNIIHDK